ncbi:MAG: TrkA family potassium uptake protein [Polyangiaceae bacterium]|nr:TrkA family potassium uptake protein [Polyangiaceae bacterium]
MKRRKRILVIGLGRFGAAVVGVLWDLGVDIVVVDSDARAVDAVKERTHAAFVADATDPTVLESLGTREIDSAVVTFGDAFEASVLVVSALRALGVTQILARAETDRRADVLRAVGATRVVEVEREMGHRVGIELVAPGPPDLLEFAARYRVVPWTAAGSLVGHTLRESGLRERYGLNVLGVRPAQQTRPARKASLMPPSPEHQIQEGDTLLLVGEDEQLKRFMDTV